MAIRDRNTLKNWFLRGMKPLANQFADWIDSYWHKNEQIPMTSVEDLASTLNSKAEKPLLDALEQQVDDALVQLQDALNQVANVIYVCEDLVNTHNTSDQAHQYIQNIIVSLQTRLNNVVSDVDIVSEPAVVKLSETKRNSATGAETTTQIPLPVASTTQHGVMPREAYAQMQNNTSRIGALEGRSTRYAVTLPNNPTQSQLTALYNSASGNSGNPAIDAVRLVDVQKNQVWTWFATDNQWHGPESDTVQQATNTSLGIVKGSTTMGKVFVETDGTQSLNGWDAVKTKLDGVAAGAEVNVQSDWNQSNSASDDFIKNKPTIPTIPGNASGSAAGLMSAADKTKLDGVAAGAEVNVQSDWNVSDSSSDAFIKNKPAIPARPAVYYQASPPATAAAGDIFVPNS
ncbi:MAG: hypothetical protein LBG92_03050 [Prevotellaceae bacterium]|jgi:hypothetical protein|nr:hypothetical protein [Prevotellaceae bacterium]